MSKITIHGIELEMNMLRATENERISKAIASAGQAADKAMSFTNEAAGLREICRIVRRCFDTAFGPGVGKQVLGDDDVGVALEAYESLVNEASRQRAEFEAKAEVLRAKYSPERSLRE